MITRNLFDTPEYRRLEALYHQQKRREKLVEYLQSKWPNVHLNIAEDEPYKRSISLIIDDITIPVITFYEYDFVPDKVIIDHLIAAIKDLKKQKRKAMMEHLLNIKRYTP